MNRKASVGQPLAGPDGEAFLRTAGWQESPA